MVYHQKDSQEGEKFQEKATPGRSMNPAIKPSGMSPKEIWILILVSIFALLAMKGLF